MAKNKSFAETTADVQRLSGGKRERAERLLEKARFMDEELMKLQAILAKKGWVETYQNGANQTGMKKSSEADVYTALSKNYMSVMKQIEDMIPEGASVDDALMDYISK